MTQVDAAALAERVARTSYGRLVALLAASTGDLALAEDSLATAFERALSTWPLRGVPDNPEGWLVTVARNRQRDVWKSSAHLLGAPLDAMDDEAIGALSPADELDVDAIPEKRLELMFVCAHPAIDAAARTPLMQQTVLGLDSARIATAFAVPAATMAQRLVRAKKRIKHARIPFVVPDRRGMQERLPAVLEAVYGAYSIGWSQRPEPSGPTEPAAPSGSTGSSGPTEPTRPIELTESSTLTGSSGQPDVDSLAAESHYLAVTLAALLDTEPEAWALAALVTLSMARAPGRSARFVPLDEQDTGTWDAALIAEGNAYLRRADTGDTIGRFQLEATIQSLHCDRARTGRTDWAALHTLYNALMVVAPSLGARVAVATVVGRLSGATAGLDDLEGAARTDPRLAGFQPYHAARGDLLVRAGRHGEAADAFRCAADLTPDPTTRDFLLCRAAAAGSRGGSTA